MQSLRCSGRNTPRRKNASNGWWSPCPLPATPLYVMEQIDELHRESETQQARLSDLEALTEQSRMLHQDFSFHQEMIESFASAVDSATLEEKRRLLRTIVKKVV